MVYLAAALLMLLSLGLKMIQSENIKFEINDVYFINGKKQKRCQKERLK